MAEDDGAIGFWSYAHVDDRSDKGRICRLATDLAEEFNLIAGRPLKLFLDRESIDWGDEWRDKIDSALISTTCLLAIITPRYFTREECRRELLEFYGQAKSAGLERLLLPILYIDVPDLTVGNDDEVVSIIGRTQFFDWRSLRLENPDSSAYRTAVNKLALKLREVEEGAASIALAQELKLPVTEPGISETVDEISLLMPAWHESVVGDRTTMAQMNATYETHITQMEKLTSRRAPRNATFATQLRLGPDLLPLVERRYRAAKIYLSRSAALDPLVLRLIRQLNEYPAGKELAADVIFSIEEAIDNITRLDASGKGGIAYLRQLSGLSQSIKKAAYLAEQGNDVAKQGNAIVVRWWNGGVGQLSTGEEYQPLMPAEDGSWGLPNDDKADDEKTIEGDVVVEP